MIKEYSSDNKPNNTERESILDFLFVQLGEYGDAREDIDKAIKYSLKEVESFGGFILLATESSGIVGAVLVNRTGMQGYIPENILVYIAVHEECRGKGYGKLLLEKAISKAEGNIALHVESENPAKFLYEKMGFKKKYNEMRLEK